ncbi:cytidine/deoxycytidylate deaminase family protein [Candidatus Roizmanbacteria bacterium]|nr:cytidine/deoxycytidylate deaminase family protein [Candidatus Roizmanbacteria bacterium]
MSSAVKRPSWDEYFLQLAEVVKRRANCLRRSVGVVIVQGKHIIATGYNGTPAGVKNCTAGGCDRCLKRHKNILKENERKDLCICIHAEENALLQSAYHGASTRGAVLYSTIAPCLQCAKAIINAGIAGVVFKENHQDNLGIKFLADAGIRTSSLS